MTTSATHQARAFSSPEVAFLVGVPLLWAILLLFHPGGEAAEIYGSVRDKVTVWLTVHVGTMLFIPLMAAAFYLLLRGVEGTAAQVARIALVPFAIFYSAYEVLQGIANGVLANEVNGLAEADRAQGVDLIQDFAESPLVRDLGVFGTIGSLGLITAAIAAGLALHRRAGAPLSVAALVGVSGLLITAHPPPFGPTGLALFIGAVLLLVRGQQAAGRSSTGPAPEMRRFPDQPLR